MNALNLNSLNKEAQTLVAAGRHEEAATVLRSAASIAPNNGKIKKALGIALLRSKQPIEAASVFSEAMALDPKDHALVLFSARAHEMTGETRKALWHYKTGLDRLFNDSLKSEAHPKKLAEYASIFVGKNLSRELSIFHEKNSDHLSSEEKKRTEGALHYFLKKTEQSNARDGRNSSFIYFPGLPSPKFIDRTLLPWAEQLEKNTDEITEELIKAIKSKNIKPQAFLGESEGYESELLHSNSHKPSWDGLFFYRHGMKFQELHKACPTTASSLEKVPIVKIERQAPEILFSALGPGTTIKTHTGVTNTRYVCHLPLIIPEKCALEVGGTVHTWKRGHLVSFDDTYPHQAWNKSEHTRYILLFDIWNPYLSPGEINFLKALIEEISI